MASPVICSHRVAAMIVRNTEGNRHRRIRCPHGVRSAPCPSAWRPLCARMLRDSQLVLGRPAHAAVRPRASNGRRGSRDGRAPPGTPRPRNPGWGGGRGPLARPRQSLLPSPISRRVFQYSAPGPVGCVAALCPAVALFVEHWRHRMTKPQISVRLDPELVATVERAAEQERRTVSNLVRKLIIDWAATRAGPDQSRQVAA